MYDEETKYLAHFCSKADEAYNNNEVDIEKTHNNDQIFGTSDSKTQNVGNQNHPSVKNQVLHSWFRNLYLGKLEDATLQSL